MNVLNKWVNSSFVASFGTLFILTLGTVVSYAPNVTKVPFI